MKRAWIWALAVLALMGTWVWLAHGSDERLPVGGSQTARVQAGESASWWARLLALTKTPVAAAANAPLPASGVAPEQAAVARPPPGQIEVCGVGYVDAEMLKGEEAPPWAADLERAATALGLRVEQHLKASADDADRVVAALLAGDAAAAAKIAHLSSNATAYGMALGSCANAAGAACESLSAARWAQLDAGNAAPWLLMASAALQRGDPAGMAEGLHRASLATTMDFGFGQMAGRVVAALPQVAVDPAWPSVAVNGHVLGAVIGLEAAVPNPAYNAISVGCSATALRDSNRQQLCRATATMMANHGRALADIGMGLGLAKRTGIPVDELSVSRADIEAGSKWLTEVQSGPLDQAMSCNAFARLPRYFAAVAQRGEWGAIREGMRASQLAASAAAVTKP